MLGSLEFCTSTLGTRLIVVLGHTQCSAIKGATKMFLESGGRMLSSAVFTVDASFMCCKSCLFVVRRCCKTKRRSSLGVSVVMLATVYSPFPLNDL